MVATRQGNGSTPHPVIVGAPPPAAAPAAKPRHPSVSTAGPRPLRGACRATPTRRQVAGGGSAVAASGGVPPRPGRHPQRPPSGTARAPRAAPLMSRGGRGGARHGTRAAAPMAAPRGRGRRVGARVAADAVVPLAPARGAADARGGAGGGGGGRGRRCRRRGAAAADGAPRRPPTGGRRRRWAPRRRRRRRRQRSGRPATTDGRAPPPPSAASCARAAAAAAAARQTLVVATPTPAPASVRSSRWSTTRSASIRLASACVRLALMTLWIHHDTRTGHYSRTCFRFLISRKRRAEGKITMDPENISSFLVSIVQGSSLDDLVLTTTTTSASAPPLPRATRLAWQWIAR